MQYTNGGSRAALRRTDARTNPGGRLSTVSAEGIYPRQHGRNCCCNQSHQANAVLPLREQGCAAGVRAGSPASTGAGGFQNLWGSAVGSPQKIVDALFRDLAVWADTPRWAGSGFTRLVVELADLPGHPARLIARRHKAMLEEHFAAVLRNAGVARPRERARAIWLLSEGAISLMLVHNDQSYVRAAATAAKQLLRSPTRKGSCF